MIYDDFDTLKISFECGVLYVTIDAPPINLLSPSMSAELNRLREQVADDDDVKVIVFRSANPDYFIAHYDLEELLVVSSRPPPVEREARKKRVLSYREMAKVTIAQIEGRARGGGSEFVLSLDMRFGVTGKTILGQPEIALGIIPGGGGTQRLPRQIGSARALEVILGGLDIDAETAAAYGYINRALPNDQIDSFVDRLARRIATYSAEAIAAAKQSTINAERLQYSEGMREEARLFRELLKSDDARNRINRALQAGAHTYDGEVDFDDLIRKMDYQTGARGRR